MPRKTHKAKPMIKALAEWSVDDALASRDQFPGKKRSRLPREYLKQELAKSAPPLPAKRKPKPEE